MSVFIIRRLLQSGVVVIIMSFIVFSGVFLIGDPVEILVSDDADQEEREEMIKSMGLEHRLHVIPADSASLDVLQIAPFEAFV